MSVREPVLEGCCIRRWSEHHCRRGGNSTCRPHTSQAPVPQTSTTSHSYSFNPQPILAPSSCLLITPSFSCSPSFSFFSLSLLLLLPASISQCARSPRLLRFPTSHTTSLCLPKPQPFSHSSLPPSCRSPRQLSPALLSLNLLLFLLLFLVTFSSSVLQLYAILGNLFSFSFLPRFFLYIRKRWTGREAVEGVRWWGRPQ